MRELGNNEVMAAISAAIATYNTSSGSKLVVRSIRRVSQNSPIWSITGRVDMINKRLN